MEIKSKPIKQIEEEAEEDLKIRIDNTEEESARTPSLFNKYHKEYRIVKFELMSVEHTQKTLVYDKTMYFSGKAHPSVYEERPLGFKIMKPDIKTHIEGDPDYLKMSLQIHMLNAKLDYIHEKMKEINRRSYHISNIINTIKFKAGVN